MYVAQFRADTVYTSQITSAVWIDPTRLRVALVPGAQEPGGTWAEPPDITGPALAGAVAAFNGGFRIQDAHGGFYLDGRQAVPARSQGPRRWSSTPTGGSISGPGGARSA